MVTELIKFVAAQIAGKTSSFADKYFAPCIKTDSGVLSFSGKDRTYMGVTDQVGRAFYIRFNGKATSSVARRLTSAGRDIEVVWPMRLVYFNINGNLPVDPGLIDAKLRAELQRLDFSTYAGEERIIRTQWNFSNVDFYSSLKEELGNQTVFPADGTAIAIDFTLRFLSSLEPCEDDCIRYEVNGCEQVVPPDSRTPFCQAVSECPEIIDHAERILALENSGMLDESTNVPFVATENIPAFTVVTATGKIADSSNVVQHRGRIIGVCIEAVVSTFSGSAVTVGKITNPLWSWSIGDIIYLNGTSLSIIPTSTGFSQRIGIAIQSDTIDIGLGEPILL